MMEHGSLAGLLDYVSDRGVAPPPNAIFSTDTLMYWVELACALQKGHTACLQRSVVGACILKWAGFNVSLQLGVATDPYRGHAWLENDGEPIGKDGDSAPEFTVIRRVR